MVDEPLDISWYLRVTDPEQWHRNYRLSKGLEPLAPIRTCSRCGGRGYVNYGPSSVAIETGSYRMRDYGTEPCPQCGG